MDLTGARWGLHGAEAILKLRALHSNGDFERMLSACAETLAGVDGCQGWGSGWGLVAFVDV